MSRLVYDWLTAILNGLPLGLGYALADALTEVHFRLFPGRRHAALANLAVILPAATRRERMQVARGMMRSYNRMMFEFLRLPHLSRRQLVESVDVVGKEHILAAHAKGKGVIICSAHVGNWELAAVILATWGLRVHAVAGVQLGRWLTSAVRETKTELAIQTVAPEDGFRKLLRALHHGDVIALMVDGDIYSHGVAVDFFGHEMRFPAGPATLAQRTGAPIIFGTCARLEPGRFRIVVEPALDPAEYPSTAALHAKIAALTESHIRAHVDQWCIFRPLWDPGVAPEAAADGGAQRVEA